MDQKLNQVIAVEKGIKTRVETAVTAAYHVIQKPTLFVGMRRTYQPKTADGDGLPPEQNLVQQRASLLLRDLTRLFTELFDVTAAKDYANTLARADVIVDGVPLLTGVPAPYLLFLEKKLVDVHTFIGKLPTLDPSATWTLDANDGLYKTPTTQLARTAKVIKGLVLHPPTKEFPAQTAQISEDVIVGHFEQFWMSGGIPREEQLRLLEKVENLTKAVKYAREQANMVPAPQPDIGKAVFGWLFG